MFKKSVVYHRSKMSGPIIITVPNSYLAAEEEELQLGSPMPSRKRKLDHLSWEEKMQRKKLKNRVAAQTSRDRKKAKMDEMEHRIQHLEDVNERLVGEVESLKALNERLLGENTSLREAAARRVPEAQRPAASSPQQQEGPPGALRAARLLIAMCLLSQTSSPTSSLTSTSIPSINLQSPSSKKLIQAIRDRLQKAQPKGNLDSVLKELKWWGPQQSTWNPVEVQA